jgi:lipoprotein-releasing system ATP-binding protein
MLEVRGVTKTFDGPTGEVRVLAGIDLTIEPGASVSIVGPSGCGKSTLLHILGTLEPPSAGSVALNGEDPFALDDRHLAAFRNRHVGFVFQDHHLLPQCSVLENVLVPTLVAADAPSDVSAQARSLIEEVGLGGRIHHRPHQLSGGERQRVALARALIQHPTLLLCDEPTGSLDEASADLVSTLLLDLHQRRGTILIIVTHNLELAARMETWYRLHDGRLQES